MARREGQESIDVEVHGVVHGAVGRADDGDLEHVRALESLEHEGGDGGGLDAFLVGEALEAGRGRTETSLLIMTIWQPQSQVQVQRCRCKRAGAGEGAQAQAKPKARARAQMQSQGRVRAQTQVHRLNQRRTRQAMARFRGNTSCSFPRIH